MGTPFRIPLRVLAVTTTLVLSSPALTEQIRGRITSVSDGDSVVLLDGIKRQHYVTLHGMDAPETQQPHGKQARRALSALAKDQWVTCTIRRHDPDQSTYHVADVELSDGRQLNEEMVRNGWAWCNPTKEKNAIHLARLEEQARTARLGLWADSNPVPPWEYRRTTGGHLIDGLPNATAETPDNAAPSKPHKPAYIPSPAERLTVYTLTNESKFHRKTCPRLVKPTGKILLSTYAAAHSSGMRPCPVCRPLDNP